MPLTLSLNTNPLVNRFADPEDLIYTVAQQIRIRDLQLTHEFINPSWAAPTITQMARRMKKAMSETGVCVTSGMTGPYGRLNHFGHPDADVRRYYINWFKTFADITAELGGKAIGSQFAIFTYKDFNDVTRREELIVIAIDCWAEVAQHAKSAGLEYLFWEPMSIGREFGETIPASLALQQRLSQAPLALPMWMMADIDHGDVTSDDPRDYDPYAWAEAVPRYSPILHIKQSMMDKGGHRPFTLQYNAAGRIQPAPLLEALAKGGAQNNEICLELSFKEREPTDSQVVADIAESVAFWADHIDSGVQDLHLVR
ncbi:MAG: TIM barrel protein [Enterobacterales bacterium endosymbiont of Blomia tropicalis]|uniref:sugar phosphate isomerase/epimerase family protein n=1 Tax=Mixta mediterraneensis TaxID=2758443 RepID=UPI0025A7051D|nr:TIM barrel protein [Mixta mediterraneensis]MDL4914503.1 TIM barrel protein [Mixta mediterraneensis]